MLIKYEIEMKSKLFFLAFLSLSVVSCTLEPMFPVPVADERMVDVSVEMGVCAQTRSSYVGAVDRIVDWTVFAYLDGKLCLEHYSSQGSRIRLMTGVPYHFYAVANMGEVRAPVNESDVGDIEYRIEGLSGFDEKGFPMAAHEVRTLSADERSLTLSLTKLVARYDLKLNMDALDKTSFELCSVSVRQSALNVFPFSDESAATVTGDCDLSTPEDVDRLSDGRTVSFYMLENCQGVLLPQNKDEWEKVPDNIPDKKDLCTYLSVKGKWSCPSQKADMEYRMYLGRDNVSDFNIERNKTYDVELFLTDAGADRSSWRVDKTNVENLLYLKFARSQIRAFFYGPKRYVRVIARPEGSKFKLVWDADEAKAKRATLSSEGGFLVAEARACYNYDSVKVRLYSESDVLMDEMTVYTVPGWNYAFFDKEGTVMGAGQVDYPPVQYGPNIETALASVYPYSDNADIAQMSLDKNKDPFLRVAALSPGYTKLWMRYAGYLEYQCLYVTPNIASFDGIPASGSTLEMKVGERRTFHLTTGPVNDQANPIAVSVSSGTSIALESVSPVRVEHYEVDDVDYGTLYRGVDFTVVAKRSGLSTVACEESYPVFKSSFKVNVTD